jgi:hypothetical protein
MKTSEWRKAAGNVVSGDKIPAGFKTRAQISVDLGLREGRTKEIVKALVDSGRAECRRFRVPSGCGISHVPHYRLKKGS